MMPTTPHCPMEGDTTDDVNDGDSSTCDDGYDDGYSNDATQIPTDATTSSTSTRRTHFDPPHQLIAARPPPRR